MSVCVSGDVLGELCKLLKLEKIEENIFRGQSQDLGFGNVFGGQVLGQALSAASQTAVSYTHLTLPTNVSMCRSRWSPDD